MKKELCFLLLFISFIHSGWCEEVDTTYTTSLTSKEGIQMLMDSQYKDAYWPLSQYYDSQINATYCGVASAVMVLNALNIPRPYSWPGDPYSMLFTQELFFQAPNHQEVTMEKVLQKGMSLRELTQAIEAWGTKNEMIYAANLTEEEFRERLKQELIHTDRFIIANYYRPVIQGVCGGHLSPIAAYDQTTDSVLIMDVYRHEFTATWVKLPRLFLAMQTMDSNFSRGFVIIKKS